LDKKKALFVINTLGQAGAEMAMLELLRQLSQMAGDRIALSVYVLMDQGELVHGLPKDVKLCNRTYCEESVLSRQGQRHLQKKVICASVRHASLMRNLPYLLDNGVQMAKKKKIQADKLLWRVISDGADIPDEEYDLAVSFLEGGAAYFVADHVQAKKKAAFIHTDYLRAGYTRTLDRDCYLKFDRIFPVSDEVKASFLAAYPELGKRTHVFHNLLNEERIHALSREGEGFNDGFQGFRILTVGRLVPLKGYDFCLQVMEQLKRTGIPVRWYVLGEGPQRRQLEKQIEQMDLKEDFILEGAKENPYPYFAQADLYVNLSKYEGKSIAIQEAQILGVPVLASDSNGNREQIMDGVNGSLCEPILEKARDEILRLIGNRELRARYARQARSVLCNDKSQMIFLTELLL
jgi:glycosyltransferase involved in cell wall biosynthesis